MIVFNTPLATQIVLFRRKDVILLTESQGVMAESWLYIENPVT